VRIINIPEGIFWTSESQLSSFSFSYDLERMELMVDNWVKTNGKLSRSALSNGILHPVTTTPLVIYPMSLLLSLPHPPQHTINNINNLESPPTIHLREGRSAHSPTDELHPTPTQTIGSCLYPCRLLLPYTINNNLKPLRDLIIQDPQSLKLLLQCMERMKFPCRSNFNIKD
jgi:hypothetical protein